MLQIVCSLHSIGMFSGMEREEKIINLCRFTNMQHLLREFITPAWKRRPISGQKQEFETSFKSSGYDIYLTERRKKQRVQDLPNLLGVSCCTLGPPTQLLQLHQHLPHYFPSVGLPVTKVCRHPERSTRQPRAKFQNILACLDAFMNQNDRLLREVHFKASGSA